LDKLTKITISGNEYPIRFDYEVLQLVSEKFEDIHKFEMDLIGFGIVGKDKENNDLYGRMKNPSISCLIFLLPIMINSALDYSGFDRVDERKIIKEIDLNYLELADILHSEMAKCFKSNTPLKKKYNPTPE